MHPHSGKSRWRTQLRGNVPWALARLVPKGPDCGAHDWYNADDQVDECYHCRATRPTISPICRRPVTPHRRLIATASPGLGVTPPPSRTCPLGAVTVPAPLPNRLGYTAGTPAASAGESVSKARASNSASVVRLLWCR